MPVLSKQRDNEQMIKNYRVLLNQAIKHCQMDDAQYPVDKWDDNYHWLGCRKGDFKKHIESQFQSGMTWDTYGTWSLDHMLPVNAFDHTDDGDIVKCWHYTNLKPEWYWFNVWKDDKIIYDMHWNGNRWIFYGRNGLWNHGSIFN